MENLMRLKVLRYQVGLRRFILIKQNQTSLQQSLYTSKLVLIRIQFSWTPLRIKLMEECSTKMNRLSLISCRGLRNTMRRMQLELPKSSLSLWFPSFLMRVSGSRISTMHSKNLSTKIRNRRQRLCKRMLMTRRIRRPSSNKLNRSLRKES